MHAEVNATTDWMQHKVQQEPQRAILQNHPPIHALLQALLQAVRHVALTGVLEVHTLQNTDCSRKAAMFSTRPGQQSAAESVSVQRMPYQRLGAVA